MLRRLHPLALVLAAVLPVTAAPAHASTATYAPVSPTGSVVSQAPLPLSTLDPVPGTSLLATDIHLARRTTALTYGARALLEGQVIVADGALPDVPVRLLARPVGSTTWSAAGSMTTSSDTGVFRFRPRPGSNTDYRVVYDGGLLYGGSSVTVRVDVARRVRDTVTQIDADEFRMSGSVAPHVVGKAVLLQRKTCKSCAWKAIQRTTTNARSRWAFRFTGPSRRGTWWFRAAVPADTRFLASYGDHVWSVTRR